MILETDRLLLKSSNCSFAEMLVQYYNKNRIFLELFEPQREDSFYRTDEQISIMQNEICLQNEKLSFRFYIFLKESPNSIIGSVALNNIVWGSFLSCFIGYKLSEDYLNRGYMTEAVRRIIDFAFDDLKLHRIEGNVMPINEPSLAVLRKCNFINEGYAPKYLQINGIWEDHIHMVLLNENI